MVTRLIHNKELSANGVHFSEQRYFSEGLVLGGIY